MGHPTSADPELGAILAEVEDEEVPRNVA